MLRPIMFASMVLRVLAGQGASPSPVATMAAVRDVTRAPRGEEIDFGGFRFHQPAPGRHGVELFQLDGEPVAGARYPITGSIGGERSIATLAFDVVDADGTVIQPLLIARRGTSVPGSSEFVGMMDVPDRPFRFRLTGQSIDGRRFHALDERLFKPQPSSAKPRKLIVPDGYPAELGSRDVLEKRADELVAEAETFASSHATAEIVMPRVDVSHVMWAPLLSAGGRPIGVRINYDVEFSQEGEYNPQLVVSNEDPAGESSDSPPLRVLTSHLEPVPNFTYPPVPPDSRVGNLLVYGADYVYDARTVYHFSAELVPDFIVTRDDSVPCLTQQRFEAAPDLEKAFAKRLAREGPRTYRVYIRDGAFEGRIDTLPGEGTLYRNFVAEGTPSCER
jgi:hypothetical protein